MILESYHALHSVSRGKNRRRTLRRRACLLLLLALSPLGCQTKNPDQTEALATVDVHDRSVESLSPALLSVFGAEGFKPVRNSPAGFVFEKPAGLMGNIAYGGLLDSSVWTRVKVRLVPIDATAIRISADAFRVRDRGDALEEEERLGRTHAAHYRQLLEAAARQAAP